MKKLPKIVSKPIVVQHKQTIDETFKLLVDEKPLHVITNANANAHTTTSNIINNDAHIDSPNSAVVADTVEQSTNDYSRSEKIIKKRNH